MPLTPSVSIVEANCVLSEILEWCLKYGQADKLLMTARMEKNNGRRVLLEPNCETEVNDIFRGLVCDSLHVNAWPGTRLGGDGVAKVYVMDFNQKTIKAILDREKELFNWVHFRPDPLPEDLCLFKSGAPYPVFFSVTHERDAWLLSNELPKLKGVVHQTKFSSLADYLPNGRYFCSI